MRVKGRIDGENAIALASDVKLGAFRRSVVEFDYPFGPFFEHHYIVFAVYVKEWSGKGRREQGLADLAQRDERSHTNAVFTDSQLKPES